MSAIFFAISLPDAISFDVFFADDNIFTRLFAFVRFSLLLSLMFSYAFLLSPLLLYVFFRRFCRCCFAADAMPPFRRYTPVIRAASLLFHQPCPRDGRHHCPLLAYSSRHYTLPRLPPDYHCWRRAAYAGGTGVFFIYACAAEVAYRAVRLCSSGYQGGYASALIAEGLLLLRHQIAGDIQRTVHWLRATPRRIL
jgi:hypothetical protein